MIMTREEILQQIQNRLQNHVSHFSEHTPKRVFYDAKAESIVKIATVVFKELGARFNIASGVDGRDHMEILYHFTFDEVDMTVSFRVKLPKSKLEIDSIAPVFEGANWIEREMRELLGINFKGHPNPKRLLLPEDWPQGVYPLRVDYQEWDKDAIRDRGV